MAEGSYCLACRTSVARATGEDAPCPTCGTPTRLHGRWRVLEPLARGGSARVFRGLDTEAGSEIALKVLDLADVGDWKQVELFERQLPLLRRLRHRGIPEVHDAFELSSGGRTRLVLVQSLHRGQNLRDALASGLRFDERAARTFLERMLDILDYLHGFSPPILHRDIKPANILLDVPDGGELADAQPVLIDFDTARGVAVDAAAADGTMVGSAGFVPLEQLAGRPVPASDLYGLGMTMIAALSQRDVLGLPVERSRVQFRRFVNVSRELADVLEKLVEPIVEDRFPDVAAVRRALAKPARAAAAAAKPARVAAAKPGGHALVKAALGGALALGATAVLIVALGSRSRTATPIPAPPRSPAAIEDPAPPAPEVEPAPSREECQRVFAVTDTPCEALPFDDLVSRQRGSIALDGDRLAVGILGPWQGKVFLRERGGATWTLPSPAGKGDERDEFGSVLALDGDTLAVGAPRATVAQTTSQSGAVHVFRRDGGRWALEATLGGRAEKSFFGSVLELSGDTLAVYQATSPSRRPVIEVYQRRDGTWSSTATLGDFERTNLTQVTFALDGDTLVVGAPKGTTADPSPAVYVYARRDASWTEQARLSLPIRTTDDRGRGIFQQFGLALERDTLAVGYAAPDGATASVHVFTRSGTAWSEQAALADPAPRLRAGPGWRLFAIALSLSGDHLAVTTHVGVWIDEEARRGTEVLLYTRSGSSWRADRTLTSAIETGTVALGAGTLAIGSHDHVFLLRPWER